MVQQLKLKAGALMIKSNDGNKTIFNWPKVLQLRNGTLTQQTDLIYVVYCKAIYIVKKTLVMKHIWPEWYKHVHYKWKVLLEAVKVLCAKNIKDNKGKQDTQYKALNAQLSNDKSFVRCIRK